MASGSVGLAVSQDPGDQRTMPQAFALKWVNAFAHLSGGGSKWASRRGNPDLWHTPLCGRSDGDVCDDSMSQSQVRTTQLK